MLIHSHLLLLLKELEKQLPPPKKCHHAMHYAKYGNNEVGWVDKLALTVNIDGLFTTLFLEDSDFNKPVGVVCSEIISQLNLEV